MTYPKKENQSTIALDSINYVQKAEAVILNIKNKQEQEKFYKPITTNQIRNLLALVNPLRERLRTEQVKPDEMMSQVQYIKLRVVYAAGRDKDSKGVRDFIERSDLIQCIDSIQDSVSQYLLVCQYLEALVAYHKFYLGKVGN